MTFQEYVTKWFHEFVKDHNDDEEWQKDLFEQMGFDNTFLDDGDKPYDFLLGMDDANEIYETMFGYSAKVGFVDDLPDTDTFLKEMLLEVGREYVKKYDFAKEFIEDMADESICYTNPLGFFQDLQTGGCLSGMIGMLIYNSECKKIYIDNMDSMDEFIDDYEEELGEPIKKNNNYAYRYVFVCHFCYEELGYKLARELWEDEF